MWSGSSKWPYTSLSLTKHSDYFTHEKKEEFAKNNTAFSGNGVGWENVILYKYRALRSIMWQQHNAWNPASQDKSFS